MRPIIFDVSRLSARVLQTTPNGIDRLDLAIGEGLMEAGAHMLLFGAAGPRLFAPGALPSPVAALEATWRERLSEAETRAILDPVVRAISGTSRRRSFQIRQPAKPARVAQALLRYGLRQGSDPVAQAPQNALFVNAAHFPLDWPSHVAWLEQRPDIAPIFAIHDLLPVERPDFFWNGEPEKHAQRLALLARRGAGAIVFSPSVAAALQAHMEGLGRRDLPIGIIPPVLSDLFYNPAPKDARLENVAYFVFCSTIEPRKNHGLILDVWRRLAREFGDRAPKLVLVGRRGWRIEALARQLDDPELGGCVIEVNGLPTPAYRLLLGQARALLSPSWAEGFGLPVAEALACQTPVLCSDIAPYQAAALSGAMLIDPAKSDDWHAAIRACAFEKATPPGSKTAPVLKSSFKQNLMTFLAQF